MLSHYCCGDTLTLSYMDPLSVQLSFEGVQYETDCMWLVQAWKKGKSRARNCTYVTIDEYRNNYD